MPDELVSLDTAKSWIGVTDDERNDLLRVMLDDATSIVIDYIEDPDHGWDEETMPGYVRAGILRMFAHLYAHRGDENYAANLRDDPGDLPLDVRMVLKRIRPPALA